VDEARAALDRALKATPNDANALSLQSIMAVVQGERDRGLQLAQAAVAADAKSASALVARSYAEQARFDLVAARASVQRAVELEPRNALAWARLAELHSSFGELDRP
jgi:tetratricopeptide (TPR) repeat protein